MAKVTGRALSCAMLLRTASLTALIKGECALDPRSLSNTSTIFFKHGSKDTIPRVLVRALEVEAKSM